MSEQKFDKVKYNNEYNANKYDRITVLLPRGYRDRIRQAAQMLNISSTAYIKQLIDQQTTKAE